ncbi:MAG: LuxR family transcriptional regulator [Sphingomonadales bacterium]|nr:LuxR family transcriptional regulator [Sphingomonadales bacterium]
MSQYDDVQSFIGSSQMVTRPEDLHGLMQDVSREMGFDHFALIHHVELPSFGRLDGPVVSRELIALSDYPQAWMDQYVRDRIVRDDPVLLASQQAVAGFAWGRIGEMIKVTSAHRALVERTRKAGIVDGFTVPANSPGEPGGSCNFAMGPGREAPRQNYLMAHVVGSLAFAAARTLAERIHGVSPKWRVRLSPRLRDCIELAGRGKSDWEIARILGLSETTVATYMKRARALYDVTSRMQVVLRALHEGEIALNAIL